MNSLNEVSKDERQSAELVPSHRVTLG